MNKLLFVNRSIFNKLPEDLREVYLKEIVENTYNSSSDFLFKDTILNISKGLLSIINENEKLIKDIGWKKYKKFDYPANKMVTGYKRIGNILIAPFDWAIIDDDFDYSFELYEIMQT